MTLQEFNQISGLEIKDQVVFDKINDLYMRTNDNKYSFCFNVIRLLKNWLWFKWFNKCLNTTDKETLVNWFILHELEFEDLDQ